MRIERWVLNLQQYQYKVEYQPGKGNPADYPSRHPTNSANTEPDDTEQYVAYIVQNAIPKAMSLQEVEEATASDPVLQSVKYALATNKWYSPQNGVSTAELSRYHKIKNELSATGTLILKTNRIVLPASLQERAVDIAHEGHQGVVKTKSMMREKVWFPMMDTLVERKVSGCIQCQSNTPKPAREPLRMTPLPDGPMKNISIDFASLAGETRY
jgi:hypothetical protein